MKILNQVGYASGLGADRWIGSGFKDAFEFLGHEFFWYMVTTDDLATRIQDVRPDILLIAQSDLSPKHRDVITRARREGVKVVVRVDSFFDRDAEVAESLKKYDLADLYFGEVEDPHMERFKKETGKPYAIIANAAHRTQHPGVFMKKYEADIVFLGSFLPDKKAMFEKLLYPLMRRYRVKVYGPGWTLKDNAMRVMARIAREVGFMKVNDWISRARISVPFEEENNLYSSAKICVNIHERGEAIKTHVILNERTFKIPACGGFEVCDFVPPLRRYFTEDEMAMADKKNGPWEEDWFKKIDYYMTHEAERKAMQERGTARALRDHTYVNRVRQMLQLLGYPSHVFARRAPHGSQ